MRRHLNAEILEHRDSAGRARDAPRNLAHLSLLEAGARAVVCNRNPAERIEKRGASARMLAEKVVCEQIFFKHHREDRAEAKRIGAGTHLKMKIRELGSLGPLWIDHNQRAVGIR